VKNNGTYEVSEISKGAPFCNSFLVMILFNSFCGHQKFNFDLFNAMMSSIAKFFYRNNDAELWLLKLNLNEPL